MIHYVYRVTLLEPFDERIYYYGKHSGELNDIGNTYFTSSKKVQKFVFEEERKFKVKIVKIFNTPEEALKFEGKIHRRLNVADHPKFFNQQNQSMSGKLDRTGRVTARNKETNEILTISIEYYKKNKHKYESISKGFVAAKDLNTGKTKRVTKEEFETNDNLVGVNHGNKTAGSWKPGMVSCKDLNAGEIKRVTKEEFESNDNLVGLSYGISKKTKCNICGKMIDNGNLGRHIDRHKRREVWITDNENKNSFKVKEIEYYKIYFETHYINGPGSQLYKNGKKWRKRKRDGIKMEKRECPYCGRMIGNPNSNFERHIKSRHKDKL